MSILLVPIKANTPLHLEVRGHLLDRVNEVVNNGDESTGR
jgi:hypothetical protein